jgi:hypothetical protein
VGLLSLASISCLQSLTILHMKGLSPCGLAASLLACGGLTKVKLHASFKSLLPKLLFEHLEARGCVFQWRDKEFQVLLLGGSEVHGETKSWFGNVFENIFKRPLFSKLLTNNSKKEQKKGRLFKTPHFRKRFTPYKNILKKQVLI